MNGTKKELINLVKSDELLPEYFTSTLSLSEAPSLNSPQYAKYQDKNDRLSSLRLQYVYPKLKDVWVEGQTNWINEKSTREEAKEGDECVYLAGNSLGLMPITTGKYIGEELAVWGKLGVLGHTQHPHSRPWIEIDKVVTSTLADIVGAKPSEVACMGTLTGNLHLLLNSFYKPTATRNKIMYEGKAFPSDSYAFASQIELHGYPTSCLLPIFPREGEHTIRTEDILKVIEEEGDSIAVICFGAVQYYSGEWFEMEKITTAGHAKGCYVGFDCAHAVGNVPLTLHDWNVDFACWCSYKYLNAGPGGIAGIFVHEDASDRRRLSGWWGHDLSTRFAMPAEFTPTPGAAGFQLSNPSVLDVISLYASLETYRTAGNLADTYKPSKDPEAVLPPILGTLREKSIRLTGYLETLLQSSKHYYSPSTLSTSAPANQSSFTIITPSTPSRRGAQLSLLFYPSETMVPIFDRLREKGVLGDERKPGVIRLAPAPMYSTFKDCYEAAKALEESLDEYLEK